MSDESQNARSPDQQFTVIDETLKRLGRRWHGVRDYRDDGIKGRYRRKRAGFHAMLEDIRTGRIKVDLILVDNVDRFGRFDEMEQIRRELRVKYGVLILTADTGFSDPTTPQGQVFGAFDAMRAREENRVKANAVRRGKRDGFRQGNWAGGPPPFGAKLRRIVSEQPGKGRDRTILEWDPETSWIVQLLFETAQAKGWGQTRLARYLNEHPDTEKYRPFHGATVGYWLDNAIYIGELSWDKHATDIIDDIRVIQKNAEETVLRIPDFCEPLIAKATWDEVQALRNARRIQLARVRQRDSMPDKQIKPLAPGMTLNYPLSGLVRCGTCQRSMVISPSPSYVTKSGAEHRYTAYFCAADCGNGIRVPEAWLRQTVFGTASDRLFLDRDPEERQASVALLIDEVRKELARMNEHELDHRPALEQEHKELLGQRQGWALSLSKPNLHPAVRESVEQQMVLASERQEDIESKLNDLDAQESSHANCLDDATILARLDRIPEILSAQNPTRTNIELSLHIDRIECFSDGRVLMRTCRLGALAPVATLLRVDASVLPGISTENGEHPAKPRRRTRRRVDDPIGEEGELRAVAEFAADPNRFSGLDEQWFWIDEFQIPKRQSWAQENALEVADARAKGWTMERVASHFGKTVPTIRAALHYACADGSFQELPGKMPRRRWHEEHAAEVVALKAKGMTTVEIAKHFKKSDTTIRAALKHAEGSQAVDAAP